ncbi:MULTISPECIES: hypothetical protein [Mycobacteriaceae]|uniref:hypothetical protein n=1 Tax=Mycobacteriaceae TaxID=1762 RepID=UPI0007FE79E6|nr:MULTISPECIES: hypothetical protein [Mycobacteriaceae]MCK0173367.1 hypothetical protein [Mycolicibacterium sp. F2034L]OBB59357.1 hypothetical protein A5757_13550 [Mycobacterium sp. 852013-51886_SCH5428379]
MKPKRSAPVRGDQRRNPRQQTRTARRGVEAAPGRARPTRDPRSAPQTSPVPRPTGRPAGQPGRPKNATQAKARAKARKAKAPKVVRPPLRERLILKLASIELNPRELLSRVPFVVLVIGALGLGLGITLWLSTGAAERSYQLGALKETNQGLLQQKEALERDVLEAQAAPALAEAARTLGMIPSRSTAHLVQDPAGNWIVVGEPKPAEGVPPPPLNTPLPEDTPPPPPAAGNPPRVVDTREVPVRVTQNPLTPAAPLGGTPHLVPGAAVPSVPGAAPAPQAPVPVVPQAPVAVPLPVPAPPAAFGPDHLAADAASPQPGPAVVGEQFAPMPGAGA